MSLILQTMVVQLPWNTNGIGASNQTAWWTFQWPGIAKPSM
jgi:hypothetical protein